MAIAEELALRGARVHLVLGPSSLEIDRPGITVQRVTSAADMYDACLKEFAAVDIAVLSAAVADYKPVEQAPEKIKKSDNGLTLQLSGDGGYPQSPWG